MKIKTVGLLGIFSLMVIKQTKKCLKNIGPCSPEMEDMLERKSRGDS